MDAQETMFVYDAILCGYVDVPCDEITPERYTLSVTQMLELGIPLDEYDF